MRNASIPPSSAVADQLTTASKQRMDRKAGDLVRMDLETVESAIRVQLGLVT